MAGVCKKMAIKGLIVNKMLVQLMMVFATRPIYRIAGLGSNGTANRLKDYIGLLISIIRYVSFYRIVNCEVVQVFSLNTDR